ncbi:MAG TPA: hypothetical protein PLF42_02070 [Anaerolineales bacterium]|nr:hypothetical protein [Anaerolineales bacterium]
MVKQLSRKNRGGGRLSSASEEVSYGSEIEIENEIQGKTQGKDHRQAEVCKDEVGQEILQQAEVCKDQAGQEIHQGGEGKNRQGNQAKNNKDGGIEVSRQKGGEIGH